MYHYTPEEERICDLALHSGHLYLGATLLSFATRICLFKMNPIQMARPQDHLPPWQDPLCSGNFWDGNGVGTIC